LRLGPVRRKWLAETAGEFIDALTIAARSAAMAATPTPRRSLTPYRKHRGLLPA